MVPDDTLLRQAADILNEGEKVAMLIGQGARGAADEVMETAELLGAGVTKALLGKDVIPDDLPFVTGPIGLLGSEATNKMIEDCDTLLMVGTSFPYSEWLPKEGQARCVEIDIDGKMIGVRYPVRRLPGRATPRTPCVPCCHSWSARTDRSWREKIESEVAAWWRVLDDRAHQEGDPLNPQLVFFELNKLLPDDAIMTSDSGSATNWWARYIMSRAEMRSSLSGTLATMLPAVPYAIAAKFAHPGAAGDRASPETVPSRCWA